MRNDANRRMVGVVTLVLLVMASVGPSAGRKPGVQMKEDEERFDLLVREDIFKGFAGDSAALERGLKACEDALAKDPKNAQALVWHGSGLSATAKAAFLARDAERGRQLHMQSVKEMNDAVGMRPDDVAVLIPRAAVMLSAATHVPMPDVAKRDFGIAAGDYEKILKLQTTYFASLPVHARGELLGGLAEAWHGLGDEAKSKGYLERMVKELPETSYSRKAGEVLAGAGKAGALGTTCLGCHVREKD